MLGDNNEKTDLDLFEEKVTTLRIIGIENESKNYEIRKPYSSG